MKKCVELKWNRRRELKMNSADFAALVGTDIHTIGKLELEEEYWDEIPQDLKNRIFETYPKRVNETEVEESNDEPEEQTVTIPSENSAIIEEFNVHNQKTMTLIEFVYEGLLESKTHSEFEANIGLLKRVLSKY